MLGSQVQAGICVHSFMLRFSLSHRGRAINKSTGTQRSLSLPSPPSISFAPLGVMNIFRIPLNAIMVVLLGLIEVKQISMGTTLALCTLIHGVGLIMYWNFERLRKRTPDVHYVSVKGQEVLDDAM
jgi:hypothetical protein